MNAFVSPAQTGNLTHNPSNDTRLDDFMKEVREFGRDSAAGKDALPNLAHKFIRAVSDGVVEMTKDADGDDGAARIFKAYAASEGKKQVHDRTEAGLKANISKFRQIGNFAGNPKWDAVEVANKTHTIRIDHKKDGIDVKPAYAALVDVAREQLKQDTQLTDGEIGALVMTTTKVKEVTLEGQLEKAHKILEDLITGEGKHGLKDQSTEILQAAEQLSVRRNALAQLKIKEEDDKALAAIMARRAPTDAIEVEAALG